MIRLSFTERENLCRVIQYGRWSKCKLKQLQGLLKKRCQKCKKRDCVAGERNSCDVRKYYIKITKILFGEG